jgi:hypothetical protein
MAVSAETAVVQQVFNLESTARRYLSEIYGEQRLYQFFMQLK